MSNSNCFFEVFILTYFIFIFTLKNKSLRFHLETRKQFHHLSLLKIGSKKSEFQLFFCVMDFKIKLKITRRNKNHCNHHES